MTSSPSPDPSSRPTRASHTCAPTKPLAPVTTTVGRGASVRALVRQSGTAPTRAGVIELVGDFTDASFAARAVDGADAIVTTVHPMGSDRQVQHEVGVVGTTTIARAAADAGVPLLVHV